MKEKTVGYDKVPEYIRSMILGNLTKYVNGDKSKVTDKLVKTAIKSVVGAPGSTIKDKPWFDKDHPEIGIYIPLLDRKRPAFTTVENFRKMIC